MKERRGDFQLIVDATVDAFQFDEWTGGVAGKTPRGHLKDKAVLRDAIYDGVFLRKIQVLAGVKIIEHQFRRTYGRERRT